MDGVERGNNEEKGHRAHVANFSQPLKLAIAQQNRQWQILEACFNNQTVKVSLVVNNPRLKPQVIY
jgi:hypothetical protein